MTTKIVDEDYLNWLRKEPCYVCGWVPKGTFQRYKGFSGCKESSPRRNAAHHTGDGVHTKRYSDHWAVPLCDLHCDPSSNNCHHREVHRYPAKWNVLLREAAKVYRERYLKEKGDAVV